MKFKLLLLLIASWLSCCESSNRQAPVANAMEISKNKYFNWDIVSADIDPSVPVENMTVAEVKDLLRKMHEADQQYRDSLHRGSKEKERSYIRKMWKNDEANLALLDKITKKYGWPGITVFGKDAAETAWLVIWHHRDSQEILDRYIPLIKKAEEKSGIAHGYASIAKQLALLQSIK